MRIAALYDIHGNLPALEAMLAEVKSSTADLVIVGGDVIPEPMPHESLAVRIHEVDGGRPSTDPLRLRGGRGKGPGHRIPASGGVRDE